VRSNVAAIVLFSLATAAHQGWSANLFTTVSDVFPKRAIASVIGIGGCLGGIGGMIFASVVPGYVVGWFGYTPLFLALSTFYLIALSIVHELMGEMKPISHAH
jgi:ACS family hexuronate transporter-like MFS transporter